MFLILAWTSTLTLISVSKHAAAPPHTIQLATVSAQKVTGSTPPEQGSEPERYGVSSWYDKQALVQLDDSESLMSLFPPLFSIRPCVGLQTSKQFLVY